MYAYSTLGELPAFLIGWTMVFEYILGSVLAAKALTQYLSVISNQTLVSTVPLPANALQSLPGFERYVDLTSAVFIFAFGIILTKNLKVGLCVHFDSKLTYTVSLVFSFFALLFCTLRRYRCRFLPSLMFSLFLLTIRYHVF